MLRIEVVRDRPSSRSLRRVNSATSEGPHACRRGRGRLPHDAFRVDARCPCRLAVVGGDLDPMSRAIWRTPVVRGSRSVGHLCECTLLGIATDMFRRWLSRTRRSPGSGDPLAVLARVGIAESPSLLAALGANLATTFRSDRFRRDLVVRGRLELVVATPVVIGNPFTSPPWGLIGR